MKQKYTKQLTLDEQRQKLDDFIQNFQDYTTDREVHELYGRKKYLIKLQLIADNISNNFQIQIEDVQEHFRKQDQKVILKGILQNTETYIKLFTRIAEKNMPVRRVPIDSQKQMIEKYENILRQQRRDNFQNKELSVRNDIQQMPASLNKKYFVSIAFSSNQKLPIQSISDLGADQIGHLIVTKGIVTRVSEVKPQISVATYTCDVCGYENYQQIFDISYFPITQCQSKKCKENKVSGKIIFMPGHSKFMAYQQVKIQQTPDQLKPGQIPITKTLYLRGTSVNTCSPGDIILLQAILLPTRRYGFRGRYQLNFQTHLLGLKITRQKKKYVEWTLTQSQIQKVNMIKRNYTDQQLFDKLSGAIAPEIYGMQTVKKALLLMMVGGVSKQTVTDNLKIRGQINIALIGDPGIAKSQLLKKIATIAPRAIYTTGKGSSGVGLTAAIVRDQKTKQIALQAGALVLADMGICCIDEFDKMGEYDRTAIHQAMQQQTISIAKAGITTTLNARTSILAAANPLYGRYKSNQTLHKNINLPPALLSRFDIADQQKDLQLAYHISTVHMREELLENNISDRNRQGQMIIDINFLRTYLAMAKQYRPVISSQLHRMFVKKYIQKRKMQVDLSRQGDTYTTTRSLLALIRLSIARAKIRFSNEVSQDDIIDSLQILQKSQESVIRTVEQYKKPKTDKMSSIYTIIKLMCLYSKDRKVSYESARNKVLMKGYSHQDFQTVIRNYQNLNVLQYSNNELQLLE